MLTGHFGGVQQLQVTEGDVGVGADLGQQAHVMRGEADDGRALEQFVGVVERQADAPVAVLFAVQLQVELGFAAVPRQLVGQQPRQATQRAQVALLVVEHDLEQTLFAGLREGFDQLVERQVLIGLGLQRGLAGAGQQLREWQADFQFRAQHQGVDEEADQALGFQARTVGAGDADADIGLPAVAVQQALEAGQQQHERRRLIVLRRRFHRAAQLGAQAQAVARGAVLLTGGTRMVSGEVQARLLIAQLRFPVIQLALGFTPGQPFALPLAVVGVTHRQRFQRQRLVLHGGGIEARELVDQHVQRPAVGDDVVQGHQQLVLLLVQAHELHPEQRAVFQVERETRLLLADRQGTGTAFIVIKLAEVDTRDCQRTGGVDPLQGHAVFFVEARAQRFMAFHQALEGRAQCVFVQFAAQVQARRNVVGAAVRIELPGEPQAVLRQGLRQPFVAGQADDAVLDLGAGLHAFDGGNEAFQGRRLEQQAQVQLDAQRFAQAGDHLRRDDGVAAQQEEVIGGGDVLDLQVLAPGTGHQFLQVGRRQQRVTGLGRARLLREHRVAVEAAIGQAGAAGGTLQLAAGGLRQGAGIEQHHHARGLLESVGHGMTQALDQFVGGHAFLHAATDLGGDANTLDTVLGDRERSDAALAHHVHFTLDGLLDVLWINILAADDQHVFQAAGDVQLAIADEAQVTGAQPGLASMLDEGLGRGLGVAPVAMGDARATGPDFADLVFAQFRQALRIGDQHAVLRLAGAAAHHRAALPRLGGIARQRLLVQTQVRNALATLAARDEQGRLGQAIGSEEAAGVETATGEFLGEGVQAVQADRLGAGIRHAPAAQVEPGQRRIADPRGAELVGEVRATADGALVVADRFQPAQWPAEEVGRGHQHARHTAEDRLQQAADQAHVVVQRQPADDHVVRVEVDAEAVADQFFVGHQVAVADLHALGQRGGTRGVLQERDMFAGQFRCLPGVGAGTVQGVDAQQRRGAIGRQFRHFQQALAQGRGGQHQARLGVGDDRQQALLMVTAIGLRRIGRHRDHTGIQAAEERRDIVRATGKQQDRPVTQRSLGLQGGRDGSRAQVQVTVGQHEALVLFVGKKPQRQFVRRLCGATLEGLGQGGWKFKRIHDGFLLDSAWQKKGRGIEKKTRPQRPARVQQCCSTGRAGGLQGLAVAPARQMLVGVAAQLAQQLGLLIDQVEVVAFEHVEGETGAGLLLPVEQFLDLDRVALAAKHMDRHRQRLAPAIGEAAAEKEIGAQDRQDQFEQFFVGDHAFTGATQLAQASDQFGVAFLDGVFTDIAPGRTCRGRGEQRQRRRQAALAQDMGQLEGQQAAEAVAEQRVGTVQLDGDFVGQVIGERHHVGLQRLVHAHATPGQLQRAHPQPGRQLLPPGAVAHGAGAGIRQAEQGQAGCFAIDAHLSFSCGCTPRP